MLRHDLHPTPIMDTPKENIMNADPKLADLQRCNEALGKKYEILREAMEQIQAGNPFPKDLAILALSKSGGVEIQF